MLHAEGTTSKLTTDNIARLPAAQEYNCGLSMEGLAAALSESQALMKSAQAVARSEMPLCNVKPRRLFFSGFLLGSSVDFIYPEILHWSKLVDPIQSIIFSLENASFLHYNGVSWASPVGARY